MKDRGARAFALIALVFAMLAAACSSGGSDGGSTSGPGGSSGKPSGTLRLFSYSDGFDPAYMASFYKEYPDIDLETASFGSNDEAIAKLQAGFQADVINSCVDEATLDMVNKGLYAPLDVSRLDALGRDLALDEGAARASRSTARSTSCPRMRERRGSCTTRTSSPRRPTRGRTSSTRSGRGGRRWKTSPSPRSTSERWRTASPTR